MPSIITAKKYTVLINGEVEKTFASYEAANEYLNNRYGIDENGNSLWHTYDCGIVDYLPEHNEINEEIEL